MRPTDDTLKQVYAGLVAEFAGKLPHTSATSTLMTGIMTGVVLHRADPAIMERIGQAVCDPATWESIQRNAASFVEALVAAHKVDEAVGRGNVN